MTTTIINYNEKISAIKNLDELKNLVSELNQKRLDNVKVTFDVKELDKKVMAINKDYETLFTSQFLSLLDNDFKTAYADLVKTPNFDRVILTEEKNGSLKIEVKKALFKFSTLENAYQLKHSKEKSVKNGQPIRNKSVTVFGALRFYGLVSAFVRNLLIENITIDNTKVYDLSHVVIADTNIFTEKDGECFSSTSNNALEKQLNILVKFFGIDVKMLKKDLVPLKLSAQKIKRDVNNNNISIHELDVLKFADILFSVITSRVNNNTIKVFTADGNELKPTEETTK